MRRLVVQREAGPLVDAPGVGQDVVGPQGHARVPGPAGETQHLVDQPDAYAQAPGPRLHQQQPQPCGGGVLAHAEHAAGGHAVHLGDPGRFSVGIPVLGVVRDDPGHQGLVRLVPAELLRVHRPVPLDHPAHVTRARRPEQVAARPRRPGEGLGDRVHRLEQPAPVAIAEAGQHVAGLVGRPGVEPRHDIAAAAGQLDDLPPSVGGRTLPGDQLVRLEPGQDPAQVARVDVDRAAQVGDLAGVALRQLEQQPRLGERVRGVQVLAPQQPDHVGVEAVEPAHRGHRRVVRGPGCRLAGWLVRPHPLLNSQFAHGTPNIQLPKSTIYLL